MYEVETKEQEIAILVGMVRNDQNRWKVEDYLDELELLAETAGAVIKGRLIQSRGQIDPAFFISKGKVQELIDLQRQVQAGLIIFDDDLSPAQIKNLERQCEVKILDRSALILDIFATRAKTHEARTQVELAQLQYILPRLTRQWTHLSRQVGGIGTKGPGETQLEVDRRQIRHRIRGLKYELGKIRREQKIRRAHRQDVYKIALVGYTNVGKSTLLNSLTQSNVFVEDRLFATLDPTVRSLRFANMPPIVLIDTVGFIRKLPHDLIASFRSTLAEAAEADLLVHMIDISHPHFHEQMEVVAEVLRDLQIDNRPLIHVFNKVDQLREPGLITKVLQEFPDSLIISAANGLFIEKLKDRLCQYAESGLQETEITLSIQQSELIARIYQLAKVLERNYLDGQVTLKIRALNWKVERIKNLVNAS